MNKTLTDSLQQPFRNLDFANLNSLLKSIESSLWPLEATIALRKQIALCFLSL